MTRAQEKELIRQAQNDPEAFGLIFDQFYPQIFAHIYRRVLDLEISKDISAEVFLRALRHLGSFRWRGISIASWLYRIASNEINGHFRRSRSQRRYFSSMSQEHGLSWRQGIGSETVESTIEHRLEAYEEFRQIQSKLKLLPIKYQEVIALKYFEDKPVKEICEILNKKEGTVKSLLSRGLDKLRLLVAESKEKGSQNEKR